MLKTYTRANCIALEQLKCTVVDESFVRKIVRCGMLHSTYSRHLRRSLGIVKLVDPDTAVAFMEMRWLHSVFLQCALDLSCVLGDRFVQFQVNSSLFAFFLRCVLNFFLKLHVVGMASDGEVCPYGKKVKRKRYSSIVTR